MIADPEEWTGIEDHRGITAPTQALLQQWLRETYGLHIRLVPWLGDKDGVGLAQFSFRLYNLRSEKSASFPVTSFKDSWPTNLYPSYQAALDAALAFSFNLIVL